MTVEWNGEELLGKYREKRRKFLKASGMLGETLAVLNQPPHIDTGTSINAKTHKPVGDDKMLVIAPISYDIFLEGRYGIMAKTLDELPEGMLKLEEQYFG